MSTAVATARAGRSHAGGGVRGPAGAAGGVTGSATTNPVIAASSATTGETSSCERPRATARNAAQPASVAISHRCDRPTRSNATTYTASATSASSDDVVAAAPNASPCSIVRISRIGPRTIGIATRMPDTAGPHRRPASDAATTRPGPSSSLVTRMLLDSAFVGSGAGTVPRMNADAAAEDEPSGRAEAPILLATKLHPPFVPAQTIVRERLFERLRDGRGLQADARRVPGRVRQVDAARRVARGRVARSARSRG